MRSPGGNSTYKKLAVLCLNDPAHAGLCFYSSSVLADSFVLLNPALRVAANRYAHLHQG